MKTTTINLSEAKANLSACARRAEAGEVLTVLKHHRPVFVIAPAPAARKAQEKRPGLAEGRIRLAPDFDRTPDAVIRAFEGDS
ncbi:MAG: type II toxin-antitoxin system prevent-host-death family antitoxin [Planctomycetota bacterium]|mgnify:CR=1